MTLSATALASAATAAAPALAGGTLELLDSGGAVLASASLGTPTAAGAVVTMGGYPRTVSGTAGTIASARYRTSAAADWKTGMSVGPLSTTDPAYNALAEVKVSALAITAGQSVTISSAILTYTAPVV